MKIGTSRGAVLVFGQRRIGPAQELPSIVPSGRA